LEKLKTDSTAEIIQGLPLAEYLFKKRGSFPRDFDLPIFTFSPLSFGGLRDGGGFDR
jgi:hypothetical protein